MSRPASVLADELRALAAYVRVQGFTFPVGWDALPALMLEAAEKLDPHPLESDGAPAGAHPLAWWGGEYVRVDELLATREVAVATDFRLGREAFIVERRYDTAELARAGQRGEALPAWLFEALARARWTP